MTKSLSGQPARRDRPDDGGGRGEGADAVVAMGANTSEMGGTWTEICAYGTAVRARKL